MATITCNTKKDCSILYKSFNLLILLLNDVIPFLLSIMDPNFSELLFAQLSCNAVENFSSLNITLVASW